MRYGKAIVTLALVLGGSLSLEFPSQGFEAAPVLAQAMDQRKAEADWLFQQGNQQYRARQHRAALQSFEQALTLYRTLENHYGEATALFNLGVIYRALSQFEQAINYYAQALHLFQTLNDRNGQADTLLNLGSAFRSLSKYQKAINHYTQALPLFQALHDLKGEANILNSLGITYGFLSQYEQAIEYHTQALSIYRVIPDRKGEATALMNLAIAYHSLSQCEKAIEYHTQALSIYRVIPDRKGEATALVNLAIAYHSLSQYEKAIEYHTQASSIYQSIQDRDGEAKALMNLADVYRSLSQYEKAISYYNQALDLQQTVSDSNEKAEALLTLGRAFLSLSQPKRAIDYHTQALSIYRTIQDRHGEANALANLGSAYASLSKYDRAVSYYTQALPIFQGAQDRNGEAATLNNLGLAYASLLEHDQAISYYTQALPIFQAIKDQIGEGKVFNNFGALFAKRNEPELAIVFYKQSVSVREKIRDGLRNLPRESQESYTQSVAGTYRALADLLIAQGRIGEAQQVLERLKLQELNDFTKGTRAAAPIAEVSFSPVETQVKTKYTSLIAFGGDYYTCEQQQPRCPQYSDLKTQYQSLSKEFQAFVEQIKQQLRDSRLSQVDKSTQDFINSADRVVTAHPDSILIYPLVLPDKTRLLWASKGGVLSKTATCPLGEKALYGKVSQFQTLISKRGNETQIKALGKELYQCLVEPIEGELAANQIKHLIFVPDRATNYIPMGALFDGQQYLVQRFAISTVLSTSLTDTTSRLPAPQSTSILALGLSQAQGNYSALPNVEAELNAIVKEVNPAGVYPGQIFLNQKFTKAALEENIRGHRIIHIATHGEFKPENPRSSYFLLGTGTPYPIPDVQALRDLKDVDLVVLSACKTGLGGADGSGLEVSGISSFFMGDRDRAKAVMASLWDVNDTSTSLLMQQFYKHLAQGMSKAAALQKVQQEFIQGKLTDKDAPAQSRDTSLTVTIDPGTRAPHPTSFSHPYYWAPFILIGNSL